MNLFSGAKSHSFSDFSKDLALKALNIKLEVVFLFKNILANVYVKYCMFSPLLEEVPCLGPEDLANNLLQANDTIERWHEFLPPTVHVNSTIPETGWLTVSEGFEWNSAIPNGAGEFQQLTLNLVSFQKFQKILLFVSMSKWYKFNHYEITFGWKMIDFDSKFKFFSWFSQIPRMKNLKKVSFYVLNGTSLNRQVLVFSSCVFLVVGKVNWWDLTPRIILWGIKTVYRH